MDGTRFHPSTREIGPARIAHIARSRPPRLENILCALQALLEGAAGTRTRANTTPADPNQHSPVPLVPDLGGVEALVRVHLVLRRPGSSSLHIRPSVRLEQQPADQLRRVTVGPRFTSAEHQRLVRAANADGETPAAFVREVLIAHLDGKDKPVKQRPAPLVGPDAVRELNAIGRNLNQSVTALNMIARDVRGDTGGGADLKAALGRMGETIRQLREVLAEIVTRR